MNSCNLFLMESFFLPECLDRLPLFINAMNKKEESTCASIFQLQVCHVLEKGYNGRREFNPHFESFKTLIKLDQKRIINKLRLFRADCSMLAPSKPGDDLEND